MEALSVIVLIIVAIVNAVIKNKQNAEAAKKTQNRTAPGRTATPQPRSQAAMVEEQRRRAEAYRQRQPQSQVSHNYETPPWKRVPTEPANAAPAPEKRPVPVAATPVLEQRPAFAAAGKPVPPPAEQLCVVVPTPASAAKPLAQTSKTPLREKTQAAESLSSPHPLLPAAGSEDWRRALVLAEVLAPPKSKRGPGYRVL